MKLRPSVLEFVVADMAVTLAFYRRLGPDIPCASGIPARAPSRARPIRRMRPSRRGP